MIRKGMIVRTPDGEKLGRVAGVDGEMFTIEHCGGAVQTILISARRRLRIQRGQIDLDSRCGQFNFDHMHQTATFGLISFDARVSDPAEDFCWRRRQWPGPPEVGLNDNGGKRN